MVVARGKVGRGKVEKEVKYMMTEKNLTLGGEHTMFTTQIYR